MLAVGLATREIEPPCGDCEMRSDMRDQWGCDADAAETVAVVDCPRCFGSSETCERCKGVGSEAVYRCPSMLVDDESRVIVDASVESEKGAWPEPGGYLDQSPRFIRARQIVIERVNRYREQKVREKSRG